MGRPNRRQKALAKPVELVGGLLIIALFAVFEKRRDDMLQLIENLKTWER